MRRPSGSKAGRRRPPPGGRDTDLRDLSFLTALLREGRPRDIVYLAAVPAALIALFALPELTRERLALSVAEPTVPTAYTSHFVHFSAGHLLDNLGIYALLAVPTYLMAALSGRRTDFYVVLWTLLLAYPFVLSGLDLLLLGEGLIYGFSAINVALAGALPVILLRYLRAQAADAFRQDHSPFFFFVGVGAIALRTAVAQPALLVVTAVAGVAALVYLWAMWRDLSGATTADLRRALGRSGYIELAGVAAVAFAVVLGIAFPSDPIRDGAVVNLYTHLLGFSFGYIATYVTFRIDDADPLPSPS